MISGFRDRHDAARQLAERLSAAGGAVPYCDTTRVVEPLERSGLSERGQLPETYPSAL
jgi:hypothetical protein